MRSSRCACTVSRITGSADFASVTSLMYRASSSVIENFERYRYADSLDFLRKLEASKLFDEEASDGK